MNTNLLIHRCDILAEAKRREGYEYVGDFETISENVPCRKDSSKVNVSDTERRYNSNDDLFFFNPDTNIETGNQIYFENESFDVIDVNKMYDNVSLHHLEVIGRKISYE